MLRLGVIGYDDRTVINAQALGCTVQAIYDSSIRSAEHVPESCVNKHVAVFDRPEDLLGSKHIDAVIIAGPYKNRAHSLYVAVSRRLPVLVLRPLAIDAVGWATAQKALQYAQQEGIVVTSNQDRRYAPPYIWAKNQLRSLGTLFGTLQNVDLNLWCCKQEEGDTLLLRHWPDQIDYLRALLGDRLPITAERIKGRKNPYRVMGTVGSVTFTCSGLATLNRKEAAFEVIRLSFEKGVCAVNSESGVVTSTHYEMSATTKREATHEITPTDPRMCGLGVVRDFLAKTQGAEKPKYSDLAINTESTVFLATSDRYVRQ